MKSDNFFSFILFIAFIAFVFYDGCTKARSRLLDLTMVTTQLNEPHIPSETEVSISQESSRILAVDL
jgi:hypothetical protein